MQVQWEKVGGEVGEGWAAAAAGGTCWWWLAGRKGDAGPVTSNHHHHQPFIRQNMDFPPKKASAFVVEPESRNCPITGGAVERERLGR